MSNGTHNIIFERTIRSSALVSLPLTKHRFVFSWPDASTRRYFSPPRRPADTPIRRHVLLPHADTPTRLSRTPTRRHADTPTRSSPPRRYATRLSRTPPARHADTPTFSRTPTRPRPADTPTRSSSPTADPPIRRPADTFLPNADADPPTRFSPTPTRRYVSPTAPLRNPSPRPGPAPRHLSKSLRLKRYALPLSGRR